jgi:hypothetical protein
VLLFALTEGLYFPSAHASHTLAAAVELNFPSGQSEQDTPPVDSLYLPTVQLVQVDSLEAPTEELNFPAEQEEQVAALSVELYFPAVQSKQDVAAAVELYFPAVQEVQVDSLEAPK